MTRKRNLIYLAIALAIVLGIWGKQRSVTTERAQEVISSFSEWQSQGKPVIVRTAKKKDVPVYTKVTFWQISPQVFEGQVSREVRDQLSAGQEMLFRVDGLDFQGSISQISEEISFDSGMYPVRVAFERTFDIPGWRVAYAHTGTMRNVINIPNEIIDQEGDQYFIWKVRNGRAARERISIERRDGYGAVIAQGVEAGDVIVVGGFTLLRDGDRVNILKENIEEK